MSATWQAGSTSPPIPFTITEAGAPLDLSDLTVEFLFAPKGQAAAWLRECTKDEPQTAGICHYDWQEGDLEESGEYEGQLLFTDAQGKVEMSPPFAIIVARSIPEPEPEPET
jgi:hypothetical protein